MSISEVFSVHAPYSVIINVWRRGETFINLEFSQLNSSNTKLYIYCGQNTKFQNEYIFDITQWANI